MLDPRHVARNAPKAHQPRVQKWGVSHTQLAQPRQHNLSTIVLQTLATRTQFKATVESHLCDLDLQLVSVGEVVGRHTKAATGNLLDG